MLRYYFPIHSYRLRQFLHIFHKTVQSAVAAGDSFLDFYIDVCIDIYIDSDIRIRIFRYTPVHEVGLNLCPL